MSKYTEESAVKLLNAIVGINVDTKSKVIEVGKDLMVGNGAWGKIDYLTKYNGYTFLRSSGKPKSSSKGNKKGNKKIEGKGEGK